MLRFYSAADIDRLLDLPSLADALSAAFAGTAVAPQRHVHRLPADAADAPDDTLLLMPAWDASAVALKLVTVMPGNAARGQPTVRALVVLLDRATGAPRALFDGEALTLRRTAAASLLAARHLAPPAVHTVTVVGTGALAPVMAQAHATLPGVQRVQVWGRDAGRAEVMVRRLREAGLPAVRVDVLEHAVRAAQLVCCATTAHAPLVRGDWVAPGTHVDLVGAFRPDMRESDDALVARARVYVDTRAGALAEAGDLLQPLASGAIGPAHVVGELADLVTGRVPGRRDAREVTLFKSVGTALEDLAAAALVVKRGEADA